LANGIVGARVPAAAKIMPQRDWVLAWNMPKISLEMGGVLGELSMSLWVKWRAYEEILYWVLVDRLLTFILPHLFVEKGTLSW
jgi:hypothetical protein